MGTVILMGEVTSYRDGDGDGYGAGYGYGYGDVDGYGYGDGYVDAEYIAHIPHKPVELADIVENHLIYGLVRRVLNGTN